MNLKSIVLPCMFLLHIHVLGLHVDTILFVQYSELRTGDEGRKTQKKIA